MAASIGTHKENKNTELEQENLSTEASSENKMSVQEVTERLATAGQKLLLFTPPTSQNSSNMLLYTVTLLKNLEEKIALIHSSVRTQHENLAKRIKKLEPEKEIRINIDLNQSQKSITKYTHLLDRILEEISHEKKTLQNYISLKQPTYLTVLIQDPDTFDAYVRTKTNRVKRQVKKIEKDLHISFSRYQFSFENHTKRLNQVESYLALSKTTQK